MPESVKNDIPFELWQEKRNIFILYFEARLSCIWNFNWLHVVLWSTIMSRNCGEREKWKTNRFWFFSIHTNVASEEKMRIYVFTSCWVSWTVSSFLIAFYQAVKEKLQAISQKDHSQFRAMRNAASYSASVLARKLEKNSKIRSLLPSFAQCILILLSIFSRSRRMWFCLFMLPIWFQLFITQCERWEKSLQSHLYFSLWRVFYGSLINFPTMVNCCVCAQLKSRSGLQLHNFISTTRIYSHNWQKIYTFSVWNMFSIHLARRMMLCDVYGCIFVPRILCKSLSFIWEQITTTKSLTRPECRSVRIHAFMDITILTSDRSSKFR